MLARAAALLITSIAGLVCVAAQSQEQQPPPTFRSETNLVEIDAIVTGRDGRFVPNLTRDDFELVEEGQAQQIVAFSMVHIPAAPLPVRDDPVSAVDPDTVSNRDPFAGRIYLLILDDLHTDFTRAGFVRQAARNFIERHLSPGDLAAIFFTSSRTHAQDFTSSRTRLLAAVDQFTGSRLTSHGVVMAEDAAMNRYVLPTAGPPAGLAASHVEHEIVRAKMSMDVLKQMSDFLGSIRGRRKSVLFFSEGNSVLTLPNATSVRQAMRDAVAASTRANASIYPIGPSTYFLRSLAEDTQGLTSLTTDDTASVLARIAEDSSSYYLLGYYAPEGPRDGRFRKVDVRVRRPGLTVRARPGYYAPVAGRSDAVATPSGGKASAELQAALRSPLPTVGLAFAASATPFRGTGTNASVALVVEIDPAGIGFTQRQGVQHAEIELQVTATDPIAKPPINSTHHLAHFRMGPETYDTVRREGVRIVRRIDLPPGRHRLHWGLRDKTNGNTGTVFTDLDVPQFTAPPRAMSGIVLVSAAATRVPTIEPDLALSAVLPGAHTARREFPLNDTLAVFVEAYDDASASSSSVRVTTSVLDALGREVFSAPAEDVGDALSSGPKRKPGSGRFGYRVTIPASKLGAGRFLMRVQAVPATGGDAIVREVPFEVR